MGILMRSRSDLAGVPFTRPSAPLLPEAVARVGTAGLLEMPLPRSLAGEKLGIVRQEAKTLKGGTSNGRPDRLRE